MTIVLKTNSEKCVGCLICESFCSHYHEGAIWPDRARLRILFTDDDGPFKVNICRQCNNARCASACPTGAITLNEATGVWEVDVKLCNGCGDCVEACPFNAMFITDDGVAYKCDLCDGEPQCAAMCPHEAVIVKEK
jgi:anaerobic carbon-monoxide dehydrogenase iron sulfur subunit